VSSAKAAAGERRHDGISYLQEQKARGVATPLMPAYEAEVLRRTGATDLEDAWTGIRADWSPGDRPLGSDDPLGLPLNPVEPLP
jgi:hypothetical protein